MKKLLTMILIGIAGFVGYATYDSYRGGYFSIPDLPDGAYPISFKNGFRAILIDAEVSRPGMGEGIKFFRRLSMANPERKYLGLPLNVPPWFEDAWSWCKRPAEEEYAKLPPMPEDLQQLFANSRLEGICRIDVDGQEIIRGLLFSVPNL